MSAPTVLLCGYGAFGALHAAAWQRTKSPPRLLVSDPDPGAQARARAQGIADVAATPEAFLGEAGIVDIVTPPGLHLPVALEALRRGKHVFVEKPAVVSSDEARRLMAAIATAGTTVQVGFVLRCHPLTLRAGALLAEGAIGRLLSVEGDFSGWKRMRADSSIIENDGVHFLDLMRHLAGAPVRAADARAASLLGGRRADDIRIALSHENGVTGHLRLGVLACGETEDGFMPGAVTTKRLRLIGDGGNLVLDFNRNTLTHAQVAYEESAGGWNVTPGAIVCEQVVGVTPVSLLAASFDVFMAASAGSGPVLCPAGEGALEMACLLEAIDRALARPPAPPIELEV